MADSNNTRPATRAQVSRPVTYTTSPPPRGRCEPQNTPRRKPAPSEFNLFTCWHCHYTVTCSNLPNSNCITALYSFERIKHSNNKFGLKSKSSGKYDTACCNPGDQSTWGQISNKWLSYGSNLLTDVTRLAHDSPAIPRVRHGNQVYGMLCHMSKSLVFVALKISLPVLWISSLPGHLPVKGQAGRWLTARPHHLYHGTVSQSHPLSY